MKPTDLQRARLEVIRARLQLAMTDAQLNQFALAVGRMHPSTVSRVMQTGNCRLTTLMEIADALGCDLDIRFLKRSA